jgi:hypothetical protein
MINPASASRKTVPIVLTAGLVGLVSLSGCAPIAGFTTAMLFPNKTIQAKYEPDPDKVTMVYVDDTGLQARSPRLTRMLTEYMLVELQEAEVVNQTVPYRKIFWIQSGQDAYNTLSADQIACRLDAEQLILVKIKELSIEDPETPGMYRGKLAVNVSVRDPHQGTEIWPRDQIDGFPMPPVTLKEEASDSRYFGQQIEWELVNRTAPAVIQLFYEHKVPRI